MGFRIRLNLGMAMKVKSLIIIEAEAIVSPHEHAFMLKFSKPASAYFERMLYPFL